MKSLAALLVALSFPLGSSGIVAAAPAPGNPGPTITIRLDGPPADRALIDLALTVDGIEVDNTRCTTVSPEGLPALECAQLDAGTYALRITGATGDMVIETFCTDLVATPVEPDAIPVDPRVGDVYCDISAARPSILFTGQYDNPFDPVLLDSNDDAVICTQDDLTIDFAASAIVFQRRWCPTPTGSYRVDRDSIDPVFVESFSCDRFFGDFGLGADPFGEIEVDGSVPWLTCGQGSVGPVVVNVDWSGPIGQAAAWFDDIELTLRDEDGVATPCTTVDEFSEPGVRAARFVCDVFIGLFSATLAGVPSGAVAVGEFGEPSDPSMPCGSIDNQVGLQGRCAVSITTPDAPVPDDVELPATGRTAAPMLVVGFGLLVLGLGLLAGSKRRIV